MEMESTRRSIDRSREPGAKKPRLVEDRGLNGAMDRERSYSSSKVPSGTGLPTTGQVPSRFKVNERERDVERNDSVRSNSVRGGVQLQQQQQQTQPKPQQQNQELVSQYKTALAELTFNSKPIITNLTIIAGENLHVAKWIAATVCANILEVPSEQKLPSLYLLDSIVKNIGRDYIKYFAARLPEVFCKAYRQVDSSVHPGMRHLFGTWKSVFPPACLQMIEKELGFSPAANGSSSGAVASRSESQSQRPPHSIHVNPKYLEARQRNLQQSNRVKGVSANSGSSVPSDDDDAEKPDGNPMAGSERPWTELPIKGLKHPKREASSESLHEKNNVGYEDNEYSSDLSRNSDMGYARAGERVLEQDGCDKSWFGADINVPEATISQRNTFDNQRELSKYRDPRPGVAAQLLQKGPTQSVAQSGRVMNKNWKNSEEEEYMWDDMSSRYPKKERWTGDAEKMEIEDRLPQPHGEIDIGSRVHGDALADSLSSTHRGQTTFGHRTPSSWPPRESQSGDGSKPIGRTSRISGESEGHPSTLGGLSSGTGSLTRTGLRAPSGLSVGVTPTVESLLNTVSSAGILGQKRHQPQQAASPSRQSPMLLHPSSPSSSHRLHHESNNLTEDDRLQTRSSYLLGQSTAHHPLLPNRTYHAHPIKNSFPTISHTQSGVLQFQSIQSQPPQHMQNPSSSMQLSQRQHHGLFSMQSQPDLSTSRPSGEIQKQLPPSSVIGNPTKMGQSVLNHSSNPSMDIAGHSNASNMLATLIKSGVFSNSSVTSGFPNMGLQDSSTLTPQLSSRPPLPSGPPPIQLTSSAPTVPILDPLATQSLRSSGLPPLPPGPPPSSASGTPHTASVANTSGFPIDFILNSLVGKGLISAEKESPAHRSPQLPSQPQKQSPSLTISSLLQAPSNPSPQTMATSSSGNDLSLPESPGSQATPTVSKDLIGTEFKADVIRQSHLSVISALHCLPHQCNICGLRLKYRERLDRHMEWHALKKLDTTSSRTSRRWYENLGDWVHGSVRSASGPTTLCSAKGLVAGVDKSEPGVPADETQCVCVLCGELFEDFYSHERDEWMFKGAAYLPIPALGGEVPDEGPIVHKNCISPSSVYDLGLMKQEQMNG